MLTDPSWRMLLVVMLIALIWAWHRRQLPRPSPVATQRQRLLKPRTPDDCPACRRHAAATDAQVAHPTVRPWSAVKSRRGAPKRIASQGCACPNRACTYYQITDARVHALVGDGAHGQRERIQTLRCQACGTMAHAARYAALPTQNRLPPGC